MGSVGSGKSSLVERIRRGTGSIGPFEGRSVHEEAWAPCRRDLPTDTWLDSPYRTLGTHLLAHQRSFSDLPNRKLLYLMFTLDFLMY